MKKIIIFGLILSLAIYLGCRKKTDAPGPGVQSGHTPGPCVPRVTPLYNARLLACKYKKGSYWVFKDSVSGTIDTLSVQALNRTPVLYMGQGCDTLETFRVILAFKNETIPAFKNMTCHIFQDNVRLYNDFIWGTGYNPDKIYIIGSNDADGCKMHDSLLIANTYYKDVGESNAIQFVQADPNRMESQSMKIFFSPEWGILQLDFRDRIGGQLTRRHQAMTRNIVR